jgi:hypothetical protein
MLVAQKMYSSVVRGHRASARIVVMLLVLVGLLSAAHASARDIPSDLIDALNNESQLAKELAQLKHCRTHDQSLKDNFTFEPFDLHRQPAWLLTGAGCLGGANSSPLLLYVRDAKGWRKVLDTTGEGLSLCTDADPPCPTLDVPTAKTDSLHSLPDLALEGHYSANGSTQTVLRYDGNVYQPLRCYLLQYEVPRTSQTPTKPQVKPLSLKDCYRGY